MTPLVPYLPNRMPGKRGHALLGGFPHPFSLSYTYILQLLTVCRDFIHLGSFVLYAWVFNFLLK